MQPVRQGRSDDPRPSFANDGGERRGGGFSLFGWGKTASRALPPQPAHEINLDPDIEEAPPRPRAHATADAGRDAALDDELEIPAFLRRQMGPR